MKRCRTIRIGDGASLLLWCEIVHVLVAFWLRDDGHNDQPAMTEVEDPKIWFQAREHDVQRQEIML